MSFRQPPGIAGLRHILRDADSENPSLPVDGSMLEEDERCPRASLFKHVLKRTRARVKPELSFGKVMHKGLQVANEGKDRAAQFAGMAQEFEGVVMPEGDYRHLGRAKELLTAYFDGYESGGYVHPGYLKEDAHREIVEAEKPFSIVLGKVEGVLEKPITVIWEGRIDWKERDEYGLWIGDFKTAKDFGPDYFSPYLGPCSSMHGYCWAVWRQTGQLPRGFIIDVLVCRKDLVRAATAKSAPRNQFERRAFPITLEVIKRWEENTLNVVEDWLRHAARGFYPQYDRKGFNCQWCEFKEVCQQQSETSARTLLNSGEFEPYTWNPLHG